MDMTLSIACTVQLERWYFREKGDNDTLVFLLIMLCMFQFN